MNNQQLIRSALVWAVVVTVFFGVIIFATQATSNRAQQQNSNNSNTANQNQNQNQNQNENSNANTATRNMNNSNATGERTGMAALSSRDSDFLMDAAMGGMMEVHLGKMAVQFGQSAAVKEFGQRMIDDHSKANAELMQLASTKGITLPTELDQKHRNQANKLQRMKGAEFDSAYAKMMLKDHSDDVEDFEKQSTRGEDPDLKAFATKSLPTLQEHLQMVRALPGNAGESNMNGNMNGNSNRNSNGNTNNSNRP
jgi:putative membrane protein